MLYSFSWEFEGTQFPSYRGTDLKEKKKTNGERSLGINCQHLSPPSSIRRNATLGRYYITRTFLFISSRRKGSSGFCTRKNVEQKRPSGISLFFSLSLSLYYMITFSKGFIHINAQCAVLYSVDVVLFFFLGCGLPPRSIFLYFFRIFS
jgi:hypothetical protein